MQFSESRTAQILFYLCQNIVVRKDDSFIYKDEDDRNLSLRKHLRICFLLVPVCVVKFMMTADAHMLPQRSVLIIFS